MSAHLVAYGSRKLSSHKDVRIYTDMSLPGYYSGVICCWFQSPCISSVFKYYYVKADVARKGSPLSHQGGLAVPTRLSVLDYSRLPDITKRLGLRDGYVHRRLILKLLFEMNQFGHQTKGTLSFRIWVTKHFQGKHDTSECVLDTHSVLLCGLQYDKFHVVRR